MSTSSTQVLTPHPNWITLGSDAPLISPQEGSPLPFNQALPLCQVTHPQIWTCSLASDTPCWATSRSECFGYPTRTLNPQTWLPPSLHRFCFHIQGILSVGTPSSPHRTLTHHAGLPWLSRWHGNLLYTVLPTALRMSSLIQEGEGITEEILNE